jgi:hypothetical protein
MREKQHPSTFDIVFVRYRPLPAQAHYLISNFYDQNCIQHFLFLGQHIHSASVVSKEKDPTKGILLRLLQTADTNSLKTRCNNRFLFLGFAVCTKCQKRRRQHSTFLEGRRSISIGLFYAVKSVSKSQFNAVNPFLRISFN